MRQKFSKLINRWSLAFVAVVMLAIVYAIPAEAEQEGVFTYTVSNGEAMITACDTSVSGQLVIPETLGGYQVTGIDKYAFKGCTSLTSISIPTKLKSVGLGAFSGCRGLTDVNITDLKAWSEIEFYSYSDNPCYYSKKLSLNGSEITQLVIPEGVTQIGNAAFANCRGITSVSIPEGVTSVGEHAFYDCSALTNISVPSSLTDIEFMAFGLCSRLESISIPEGVTSISAYAFYQCTRLKDISLPSSLTSISIGAFSECGINNINIPEGVTLIGESAFENSQLTSISIPSGVTNIEKKTFYGCSRLTSVSIPERVTGIGEQAFEGCSSMTNISIPLSVRSIERRSFYDCSGLMSVSIPEGVTSISEYAFSNCSGLTSINLPSSLMSIEDYAFSNCSGLTNVNIPENVTCIGKRAFSFCSGLTSINLPEGIKDICKEAFYCCSKLTSINIPEGITDIYSGTFWGCSALTNLSIPSSVTSIADGVFTKCDNLVLTVSNSYVRNYAIEKGIPYMLEGSSISIKALPNKISYYVGEEFVADGLTITLHYYDGTSEDFTSGYTLSGFDSSKPGSCTIEVEYHGEIASFEVTILEEIEAPTLSLFSASLQLENSFSIIFKAKTENIDGYYTDVYIVVNHKLENDETKVKIIKGVKSADGLNYEFEYNGFTAKQVGDLMDITIFGYRNGEIVTGETESNYGIAKYCLNQLGKDSSSLGLSVEKTKVFKTLLVDIINYASESQLYFGYKTDALVSAQLSEEQKAYASADSVLENMASVTNTKHEIIDNSTVTWNAATLLLKAKTIIRLKVTYAGNIDNVKLYAKVGNAKIFEVIECKEIEEDVYYFYFDSMSAQEFSKTIDFYFVEGNAIISNTLRYSVESYATKKIGDSSVGGVIGALMKYGKSAKIYADTQ